MSDDLDERVADATDAYVAAGIGNSDRDDIRVALEAAGLPDLLTERDELFEQGKRFVGERDEARADLAAAQEELAAERERTNPAILRGRIQERLRRLHAPTDDPNWLSMAEMCADHEQALERLREISGSCAQNGCQAGDLAAAQAAPTRDDFLRALKEADVSGQWSRALDLIREKLLEPLEADLAVAQAAAREMWEAIEVAHTSIRAAIDPKVEGHLGLILNAESILRFMRKRYPEFAPDNKDKEGQK